MCNFFTGETYTLLYIDIYPCVYNYVRVFVKTQSLLLENSQDGMWIS